MDNTVTVLFAAGQTRAVAAKPLYQWAYGQKLVFSGLDLPASYQVDFSNFEYAGTSIPQVGGAEGVTVPVGVLDTGRDVYAFVWIQDENAGRIEYCAEIPVIPCPEPDLEDPNPEEESAIAQAITALNAAVEQTGEDALKAEGYAVGTQDGEPVESGSPYYENNAEYMKDQAAQYALQADAFSGESAAWATGSYSGGGLPVPDSAPQHNNNAKYFAAQAEAAAEASAGSAAESAAAVSGVQDNVDRLHGLFGAVTCGATERVEGGTRILNQITGDRIAAQLGFYYDTDENKLYTYNVFGKTLEGDIATTKFYMLIQSGPGEVTGEEMTFESAAHAPQQGSGVKSIYKLRFSVSSVSTKMPLVLRLCVLYFDADGNEIGRHYSAQYEYTLENGAVVRTRMQTAAQDAGIIEDIGLSKNTDGTLTTFAYISRTDFELLPAVTTFEGTSWRFVIPDSWYADAQYGYALCARDGQHRVYCGPTIYKAEDSVFVVTLTPTALDYSGTMDKTVAEIYEAWQAGKRIYMKVSSGASTVIVPISLGVNSNFEYPSFNAYLVMAENNSLIFAYTGTTNDGTRAAYSTAIYALTPAT